MNLFDAILSAEEGETIINKATGATLKIIKDGWETYTGYVDFNVAMNHIANGGRAKRKDWKWSIYINPDSVLEKIKVYNSPYSQYEVTKNDILTKDWILL